MINWRHQYDQERDEAEGAAAAIFNTLPSMTQQSHADAADINTIVRRFGITDGAIPPAVMDPAYYGDFTDAPDFRTALDRVRTAEERFRELPAEIRSRFNNDPTTLFAWVNDEKNADEAVKIGLLAKTPVQPAPTEAPAPTPAA